MFFLSVHAQGPSTGGGGKAPVGTISGQVIDAGDQAVLEYATVSLYKQPDNSLVTGGITDENGRFSIETGAGTYSVKVEYIAYEASFVENVVLSKDNMSVDVGTIQLSVSAEFIDEIEIVEEKSQLKFELDKQVYNVGKDLANTGATAQEVLDNIPSVTVDVDGNVNLRGSGNVRILVNGKPSGLVGDANGLRSLQGNIIEKVEVITNPSAKYEAEGMAGIINIVLKKNKKEGLNGSVDVHTGYPHNHGVGLNLNYRVKKFNFFGNLGGAYRIGPGSGDFKQTFTYDGITTFTDRTREHERGGWNGNGRIGFDFFANDRNTITTSFLYQQAERNNTAEVILRDFDPDRIWVNGEQRNEEEDESRMDFEYNFSFTHKFPESDHELTTDFQLTRELDDEVSDLTELLLDESNNTIGIPALMQRSFSFSEEMMYISQLDYKRPMNKDSRLETGLRFSSRDVTNDYGVNEFSDGEGWKPLLNFTNVVGYDEKIFAQYVQVGKEYGNLSYQFGLRGELSNIETALTTEGNNTKRYYDIFPSAFFTYQLEQGNSVQVSYGRRVRRPGFFELNPFFTYSDDRNIFAGNPNLDPEYTHLAQVAHIKYWDKSTMNTALYFRHTDDVIQRIRTVDDEGISYVIPENLATSRIYGVQWTLSSDPAKWFRINASTNLYYQTVDGTNLNSTYENDGFAMSARLSTRFTFWKNAALQINQVYRSPQQYAQGKIKSMYYATVSASKDVLKGKGTLTFTVDDVLNSRRFRIDTESPGFTQDMDFQWRERRFTLNFNYRINQKKNRGGGDRQFNGGGGGMEF